MICCSQRSLIRRPFTKMRFGGTSSSVAAVMIPLQIPATRSAPVASGQQRRTATPGTDGAAVTPRIRVRAQITQPRIDAADATGMHHSPRSGGFARDRQELG